MGAWGMFLLCCVVAAAAYLNRERKDAKLNREFHAKERALYRRANTAPRAENMTVGYLRDYVGEFEFANRLYDKLWDEFRIAYPIGSFYDYIDWDIGPQTLLMETESDQRRAFELAHQFSRYGNNGPEYYCIWEARKDATQRGYAPDNVREAVFPGWDARKEPGHEYLDSKNRWQTDERYTAPLVLTPGEPTRRYGCYAVLDSHVENGKTQYCRIFPSRLSKGIFDSECQAIKKYLRKWQDRENAIIRHRMGDDEAVVKKPLREIKQKWDAGSVFLGTLFMLDALLAFVLAGVDHDVAAGTIFAGVLFALIGLAMFRVAKG